MNSFIPLHVISGYSFLQSGLTIEKIEKALKEENYLGMGLTDYQNLHALPEFTLALEKAGKKYIVGVNLSIDKDNFSLFIKNEEGYKNIIQILLYLEDNELDFTTLKKYSDGLICVLEAKSSNFKEQFNNFETSPTTFTKYLLTYSDIFKDDFYIGTEVTSKEEANYVKKIREFAKKYPYELVAFPSIRYLKKEDAITLEITNAIANDYKIKDKKKDGPEFFLKESDYHRVYSEKEIYNTNQILEKSSFNFHQKRGQTLSFDVNDPKETLKEKCEYQLKALSLSDNQVYIDRLNYELDVINSMGYADYFLLVEDYVSYAKSHEILVGPGRGSAAGSLVAYLLNITEADPIKNDLQFERFLNPNRQTMPDIDVDFMDIRRDKIVNYMREKYGQNRVGNIVTYQTIKAKQAIRDIGRVYDIPEHHISLLCKRLTNIKYDLRQSYKILPEFKKIVDDDPYFLQIVSLASKIEGLPRQTGLHAAGIILSNESLENVIPVTKDFSGNYTSQYEMNYLEEQGLLKMDFLGLRNLTTISYCVNLINTHHKDLNMSKENIPYDEKEVFDLIASGYTMGVFQLESNGMKNAIKTLKPNCFNDIVALLALFRPGPMDSIKTYALRKQGKEKINYISKDLESILSSTYGIIVYQEQINSIAQKMAGFTMGEADLFRRAVSKKNKEKILSSKDEFIKGAINNGYKEKEAEDVFNLILKFANYGFNKSHSLVYSILACREAYLKVHYPLEFYTALLQTGRDDKFNEYVSEMKARNIKIYSPDINVSTKIFIPYKDGLIYPLSKIKGVDDNTVNKILEEREKGSFIDYFDFISRMYAQKVSDVKVTKLIDAGALDIFHPSRATMINTLLSAYQFAKLNYDESGQLNIGIPKMVNPNMNVLNDDPIENLNKEYEAIGIMLSDNPLKYKRDILQSKKVLSIIEAKEQYGKVSIAGLIRNKKTITTKKGGTMAFVKLMDEESEIEVTIFPKAYVDGVSYLEKNSLIIISGRFEKNNNDNLDNEEKEEMTFIADKVMPLED